jgi:DNA-binding NarL/FixJ family response regulator
LPGILIVDDHQAARLTIRELLDWHSFQVCGDAKDGNEAVEKVIELKPEIVLMDINMPGLDGIAAATEIRRIAPATKIVFLTVHAGPGFRAGTKEWAHGYVAKSDAGTDLIPTLNRIAGITALSLSELKQRGQATGYTKIQRKHTSAKMPLGSWNGFATESGNAFSYVDVYYVLNQNQVTVFKSGKAEAHYTLS